MSDITKSKNCALFLSFDHRIHVTLFDDVFSDNLRSSATKDYTKKRSNFDYGIADKCSFILVTVTDDFFIDRLRILSHFQQFFHHILNGMNDETFNVLIEVVKQYYQYETSEQGCSYWEFTLIYIVVGLIDNCQNISFFWRWGETGSQCKIRS